MKRGGYRADAVGVSRAIDTALLLTRFIHYSITGSQLSYYQATVCTLNGLVRPYRAWPDIFFFDPLPLNSSLKHNRKVFGL